MLVLEEISDEGVEDDEKDDDKEYDGELWDVHILCRIYNIKALKLWKYHEKESL